jgi:hypothetical protein
MFRLIPWLVDDVTKRMAEVAPRATIGRLTAEPAMGALHLALRTLRGHVRVPTYIDKVANS